MVSKSQSDLGKEYRDSLSQEFKRVNDRLDGLFDKLNELHSGDIAKLNARLAVVEVKAGIFGLLGGAIPAVVILIYMMVHK